MAFADNIFNASLDILKDSSHDSFGKDDQSSSSSENQQDLVDASQSDSLSQVTVGVTDSGQDQASEVEASDGWEAKRFAIMGRLDPTGARSIERDKEFGFRPKIAKFVHDSVRYRLFKDAEGGGGSPGGDQTQTVNDVISDSLSSVTLGASASSEGGESSGWDVDSTDVGIELSLISDMEGGLKSQPDWNPFHPNSPNRSTLIVSRMKLDDSDKGEDLPDRYFGRLDDVIMAVDTQGDVKLQRVRFHGGFFSKNRSQEEYEEAVFKGVINITPEEKSIDGIDQLNEYENGPGKHGWRAFDYVHGFPIPPDGQNQPAKYTQGGWLYDAKQDALAMLHDIIGIDAEDSVGYALPRYRTSFDRKVGIAYIRHDAFFTKQADDTCPPDGDRLAGRIYFTQAAKCPTVGLHAVTPTLPTVGSAPVGAEFDFTTIKGPPTKDEGESTPVCGDMMFDPGLANKDTEIGHECGEWRPRINSSGGGGGGGHDHYYYCTHYDQPHEGGGSSGEENGDPTPTGGGTHTTGPQDGWVPT